MNDETLRALGKLVEGEPQRDAVHIAVIPVEAAEILFPGQPVLLSNGKAVLSPVKDAIGAVDPFLKVEVNPGQRFWLFMNPGSITSLRHEWGHPAFSADKTESEEWLKDFFGTYYSDGQPAYLDEIAKLLRGETPVVHGTEGNHPTSEFWHHLERFLGRPVPAAVRDVEYFSCSC